MITDIDIYRCAEMIVRQHGEDAALFAAERADALLAAGDVEGQVIWKRIVRAVVDIQQRTPVAGQRLN